MSNKILLIDDEKIICTGLSRELKSEGYDVEWALTGADALGMVESNGFELAVIDFMLPDMDGMEVCKRINTINENIKMIVMSGYAGIFEKKKIEFDLVSSDIEFIYKPFDKEDLFELINQNFKEEGH